MLTLAIIVSCEKSIDDGPDPALLPMAAFNASATTVEAGDSITFSDASTNAPSLYTWNFEGGNPTYSNQANPTVTYEGAGTYDVMLTVRNDEGAGEILMEDHIVITAPPVIDIETQPQVRLDFEDNLDNAGLTSFTATPAAPASYGIRPGGGGAYVFNGNNQIDLTGYTGINGAGARSVALWIKTNHAATSGLVHWGQTGSFSRSSFKMQNTGEIRYEYQGGGHTIGPAVNDDEWHHIAYTYDGDKIIIYIDAVEVFSIAGKTLDTGSAGETDVNIGSQLGGSIFQGMMDDVRIFDVVLTQEEVKILSEIK